MKGGRLTDAICDIKIPPTSMMDSCLMRDGLFLWDKKYHQPEMKGKNKQWNEIAKSWCQEGEKVEY